jgi:hypothetical protein
MKSWQFMVGKTLIKNLPSDTSSCGPARFGYFRWVGDDSQFLTQDSAFSVNGGSSGRDPRTPNLNRLADFHHEPDFGTRFYLLGFSL